ncbi:MAG: NADH-dependent [FeFe] hydrogenase, group A6 [Candidatus Kapabacteria bacterium]|nr:NADH-dependent [FeFe] hydrogenase, group A6 [Candidatus Kapabacteria bacterium]
MYKSMNIDGRIVRFTDERNILEVIKKTNVELPTFCYHSELSVYGACRLCVVEIQGRGIQSACSVPPEDGMVIRTNTLKLRQMRKMTVELLLSSYAHDCTTCQKNIACKLQDIAHRLGITEIRFKKSNRELPKDYSSAALVRDPNKCILCGDCVRACNEIQGIGVLDFVNRGANAAVLPAFNKNLSEVSCVECGQCARVCPTGAILPKLEVPDVWKEIGNPEKTVVVQIAPAVRVAIGEVFGAKPGEPITGKIVAALKLMGFDKVYDTSFSADLTIFEEAEEFLKRFTAGENLPIMTSCCPAWVKYVEQFAPDMMNHLSTCKSPQQMFGSVAKEILPKLLNVKRENLVVVSIMPCTAKKAEARRPEFAQDEVRDVDYVLTTQELAAMIKEAGIKFDLLQPETIDMPLGFKTGAGVIFGTSGGVSEAVLRYVYEKVMGETLDSTDFVETRGLNGRKEITLELKGNTVRLAIVNGLKQAHDLLDEIREGKAHFDIIEVMSCPGGCIGGAGQPVPLVGDNRQARSEGLYYADKMLQLHKSQENPYVKQLYTDFLGEIGGEKAHKLLHTHYKNRKRIFGTDMTLLPGQDKIRVSVCVGTNCFMRGSQKLLRRLMEYVEENNLSEVINIHADFCQEECENGPGVRVAGKKYLHATYEMIVDAIQEELKNPTCTDKSESACESCTEKCEQA